jgi:hypothetical protein
MKSKKIGQRLLMRQCQNLLQTAKKRASMTKKTKMNLRKSDVQNKPSKNNRRT